MHRTLFFALALPGVAAAQSFELSHSGRLMDATGQSVSATVDLQVALYASETGGSPLWSASYDDVLVQDGFFTVMLGDDDVGVGLDDALLANPGDIYIGTTAGALSANRKRLVSVPRSLVALSVSTPGTAVHADGRLVLRSSTGGACETDGELVYNPELGTIQVCSAGTLATAAARTIVQTEGVRLWSDGSYATSCNAYRYPAGDRYAGQTGSGVYRIAPDHQAPFDVYCDMETDGGGWTMVGSFVNGDGSWNWTRYASGANNISTWRDATTFGTVESRLTADHKSAAYGRVNGSALLATDSSGGWAAYDNALDGTLLQTVTGVSGCTTSPRPNVTVRSSDPLHASNGFLTFYGADPNNGGRCAFNVQLDATDSSVIGMAGTGCGTAGFGHLGYLSSNGHEDRDALFCLAEPATLNSSGSCGAWYGTSGPSWFGTGCSYSLLFVR